MDGSDERGRLWTGNEKGWRRVSGGGGGGAGGCIVFEDVTREGEGRPRGKRQDDFSFLLQIKIIKNKPTEVEKMKKIIANRIREGCHSD